MNKPDSWKQGLPRQQAVAFVGSIRGWLSNLQEGCSTNEKVVANIQKELDNLNVLHEFWLKENWGGEIKKPAPLTPYEEHVDNIVHEYGFFDGVNINNDFTKYFDSGVRVKIRINMNGKIGKELTGYVDIEGDCQPYLKLVHRSVKYTKIDHSYELVAVQNENGKYIPVT